MGAGLGVGQMIVNGEHLLQTGAMRPMLQSKDRLHGVSYGLANHFQPSISIKPSIELQSRMAKFDLLQRFNMARNVSGI